MTDRELLGAAAQAAGIKALRCPNGVLRDCTGLHPTMNIFSAPEWSPLIDDGDALRLAVRLGLHARQFPILDDGFDVPLGMVEVWRVDDDDPLHVEFLRSGDDRLVATRRAIVRAAAAIGRNMT